jgi:hypothetical protein
MKRIALLILGCAMAAAVYAQGPDVTSWLQNTTVTGYDGYTSNVQLVQYGANDVYVTCTSIPEYTIGPWPGDPNVPAAQNFVFEFPRNPVHNTGTPTWTYLGPIGLWSNGVAIYNGKDAHYWDNATSTFSMGEDTTGSGWNRNALIFEGTSFDDCLGHPDQGHIYHHHVNPKCLYNDLDSTHHSPIIGYALDGFPIYGAYGYANATTVGAIKRMQTSYVLSTATTRASGPPVNTSYPEGSMCEDYIYTAGAGDLDEHNGRYCVTPDYPGGTYAYFVTIDSSLNPVYPFVLGPTYYGYVGSTIPHVTPVGPDTTYNVPTSVAQVNNTTIKFQVVPNPVTDHAYIYMDVSNMNNVKGCLYDATGKLLQTIDFMQPTIAYAMDMSSLPAGLYLLRFEGNGVQVTQKLIKQ